VRTWHYEMIFVAVTLSAVAACSQIFLGKGVVEWVGALAVLLTFAHVQVADRLAEAEATREELHARASRLSQEYEHLVCKPALEDVRDAERRYHLHVDCHHWARRYLVGKEICWLIYFVVLGAYTALVGVAVFLAYPIWRHQYRKRWGKERHA